MAKKNKYYYVITYYGQLVKYELKYINPEKESVIIYAKNIKRIQEELLADIKKIKISEATSLMAYKKAKIIPNFQKLKKLILVTICDPIMGSVDDVKVYSLKIKGEIIGKAPKNHRLKDFVRIKAGETMFFVKKGLIIS